MTHLMSHLTTNSSLYIGVMTGTSLDGLDAVLADFSVPNRPHILAHTSIDYPLDLRLEMLALQASIDGTGINELHRSRIAAIALSDLHIQALQQLLRKASIDSQHVAAIGVHGQTVRHLPQGVCDKYSTAYTIQLLEPTRIAEALQCIVVSDFRARDIAAGGQGAPLVPAFHASLSADITKPIAFVNIGGFANVTLLNPLKNPLNITSIQGFDTGPGNVLMDGWIQKHLNQVYDSDGTWAASGQIHRGLLLCLQSHPYFLQPAPKSTGREVFNINWLESILNRDEYLCQKLSPADVQATLCELTAITIAQAVNQYSPECSHLLVCGGGAYNHHLMQRLSSYVPCDVATTEIIGIAPQQMEALAFAWLARQCMLGLPANLPMVTGAAGLRVLGSICPA
jgi:anhydro-N-acetylmuramic acid kinase